MLPFVILELFSTCKGNVLCLCKMHSLKYSLALLQNVYVNINRIVSVASRLVESGHYASQQIKQIANQLEQEWKMFASALDERSTLLEMSAKFHQKAEKVKYVTSLTECLLFLNCLYIKIKLVFRI